MEVLSKMLFSCCLAFLFIQCEDDDSKNPVGMFTVTIENVSEPADFFQTGVFTTPVGRTEAGPALPGNSFSFSFHGGKGQMLSFATMYGTSNDLFYAPMGGGIALFDGDEPVTGDITAMIGLWDAGTEVNEEPGIGPNTGPQQSGPNTGPDENATVRAIGDINDGFSYPAVNQNIKVMIAYDGTSMYTVTIENMSMSTTPLSPGVWVIHSRPNALFEEGQDDYGNGLEHIAEDGNPAVLGENLMMNSGYVSPLAPGVWVVHQAGEMPLFAKDEADYGDGLEALSEDGNPAILGATLMDADYENSGVFNTPVGAGAPGPLMPGGKFSFSFEAGAGDYLGFATMLGESNDLFFAPADMGISLFDGTEPLSGDITPMIMLWDAGTEVNEYPGAGIHQPARLNGGTDEDGAVMLLDDDFTYPEVKNVIKVTITGM